MVLLFVLLFTPNVLMAEEIVNVKIPFYNVTINETWINNYSSRYPFITYKDITYFPMTYNYCENLGLDIKWDEQIGLEINKKENHEFLNLEQELGEQNDLSKTYKAFVPDFKIMINGKKINNSKEKYPILNFRSVTYFPVTWRFIVDEFKWEMKWDEADIYKDPAEYKGLIIKTDSKFKLRHASIPKEIMPLFYQNQKKLNNNMPLIITDSFISINSIGTPEIGLGFRNLSGKVIDAFEFRVRCYDTYDRPVNRIGTRSNLFKGIFQEIIQPNEVLEATWNLTLYDNTTKINDLKITSVHFTDGTTWKR